MKLRLVFLFLILSEGLERSAICFHPISYYRLCWCKCHRISMKGICLYTFCFFPLQWGTLKTGPRGLVLFTCIFFFFFDACWLAAMQLSLDHTHLLPSQTQPADGISRKSDCGTLKILNKIPLWSSDSRQQLRTKPPIFSFISQKNIE